MAISQEQIDRWFQYHPPTSDQIAAYSDIRQAAKTYAETVNKHVPDSADKTAAMRKIRESVMAANLAVACYVEPKRPTIAELDAILNSNDNSPITLNTDGSVTAL